MSKVASRCRLKSCCPRSPCLLLTPLPPFHPAQSPCPMSSPPLVQGGSSSRLALEGAPLHPPPPSSPPGTNLAQGGEHDSPCHCKSTRPPPNKHPTPPPSGRPAHTLYREVTMTPLPLMDRSPRHTNRSFCPLVSTTALLTWMHMGKLLLSILLAVLTVSPRKQ